MKKSKRLDTVRTVSAQREKTAAEQVGQARKQLSQAEQQLSSLASYRSDYRQNLVNLGSEGVSAMLFRDYHKFLSRLDVAIDQQNQRLDKAGQQLTNALDEWAKANGKLKAMDSLITRVKLEEEKIEDKREQRILDDRPRRPQDWN